MATGGIFQLITNDGKQDRMLMATALLNKRLLEIERMRAQNPQIKDPTPTLVDIERTHILFMNAHFKPFAAIGYEYNKTQVQSGSARLGAEVQFSIPQFGDFFNDMVLHVKLSSVSAANAAYWSNPLANPARGAELIKYADFLGQRLIKKTSFTVNGNPLDEYDSDVYNMHQKFFVTPNKEVGWSRAVGQELPLQGYTNVDGLAGGRGAGLRQGVQLFNGLQTPKPTQEAADLWIPLIFWFNKDPRLAIPSVSIPYGQRYINVLFASAEEILQNLHAFDPALDNPAANPITPANAPTVDVADLYINNIFVNPEIHDIFIKRIGFSLIRVHRRQVIRTSKANDNLLLNQLKWPIETMYVGLRPVENVNTQSASMLTNWNMYAKMSEESAHLCAQNCHYYTWGAASGSTPPQASEYSTNFTGDNGGSLDFVNILNNAPFNSSPPVVNTTVLNTNQVNAVLAYSGYQPLNPAVLAAGSTPATWAEVVDATNVDECCEASYSVCSPTLDTLAIEAHGVPLYNVTPASFFNHYIPYTYGGQHIKTPVDCGVSMITFNLYPGSYQPSGHVNVSRAREFYLAFTSSVVSTDEPADLVVVAVAINFLLISDGSAVLRYST